MGLACKTGGAPSVEKLSVSGAIRDLVNCVLLARTHAARDAMTPCPRCSGNLLRDLDGVVCLQCGHRPTDKPPDVHRTREPVTPKGKRRR